MHFKIIEHFRSYEIKITSSKTAVVYLSINIENITYPLTRKIVYTASELSLKLFAVIETVKGNSHFSKLLQFM